MKYLRKECYPMMKEMALFYAAYAKKGADGYYHVIPSMEEERWGIYPKFCAQQGHRQLAVHVSLGPDAGGRRRGTAGGRCRAAKQWRKVAAQSLPIPPGRSPEGWSTP